MLNQDKEEPTAALPKIRAYVPKKRQQEYIAQWRSSGLSQASFCRKQGLKPTSFSTWIKNHALKRADTLNLNAARENHSKQKALQATQATIDSMNILFPTGVEISLKGKLEAPLIHALIKDIHRWK